MTNILTAQDKVASFLRKLQLYQRRIEVEDISMFPELTMVLDERNEKCSFTDQIALHLLSIIDSIATFWRKIGGEYPLLSEKALKILIPISKTYRCESGFSTMVTMKTKARNRLNLEHDLRCALAETEPNIKQILRKKQYQPSH
ncbi:protein FAM200A-like [Aphis gossypii]|uniref:protein FAM200A-like n=1 Tax=Aphis gossypii TaxID=80765 RepID=UPI00215913C8|nr:protein FAM200A-like [Aphis gossypii]